ncbi:discoidin domain-containing protein [Aestuariibaculum sp. M13]|uniref:glycoside hydrolase family 2 TIM barrel-domain containing protein n=1 Tax=Aestuariibaculum sp. M13 TaxID=2967132 RepID=UPI002159DEE2|nr:glycoside hydrolase family 2 TIM barrel-domain containing protein [Aestuariibaculum sp. M13]MCR8667848.1 discoidin domain-containing protein [Aestuariibaculum sp. M13]
MKKSALGLMLCFVAHCYVASAQLKGFTYGDREAPTGKEWESPSHIAHNKEQPRATFFSFKEVNTARKVLPEHSEYWKSLDGTWKFNWVKHPDLRPIEFFKPQFDVSNWDDISVPSNWNIYGLNKDGKQKYGTPIYCNQPVIFQHTVALDDWRGGVMREPAKDWVTYDARNEVGSYRRNFEIPEHWDGREIFIQFDGVDSFFYLWINGEYIGFSKNSRNAAAFNISKYIKKGNNIIAAEVYRNSDGSFLEAQDMFRLPGIFRTVQLYATPKVQIRDLFVLPELDDSFKTGSLKISADIRNFNKKTAKGYKVDYSLFENTLYSDENSHVKDAIARATIPIVEGNEQANTSAIMHITSPKLWSAEKPYRYTLVAQLKDKTGKVVETISTYTGFREVVIKDTAAEDDEFGLAGRYYYINGNTVKLKGVNRHETNPKTGHTLSREQMEQEVMLMKRANINHVRNSHYPPDPYWYYLCNKYGIYLEDEANIESHQYYYGEASLSHPPEWQNAHVGRVVEMTHQNKNHPSIVIWSLGNEAGPGKNFEHAYDALKQIDISRPVQYERNNSIVDMGSNQYPSIGWMKSAVTGTMGIKYPFHISEYAHSMGNACGNLIDYWEAIESTNFFCGGAIWDWIDQAIYNYKADGTSYLAYGGDFGDKPNSGQFVMNGILFAERDPKPQYFEVKKVYQNIGVKALDLKNGTFEVFNKYYFKSLSDYNLEWSLWENGSKIEDGQLILAPMDARTKSAISIPYNFSDFKTQSEYFIKLQFTLKENQPWAKKSYVQAEDQFLLKTKTDIPSIAKMTKAEGGENVEIIDSENNIKIVKGKGFIAKFNMLDGSLFGLNYDGNTIITDGYGPKLDAFRAFVNNDTWGYQSWYEKGLHNLKHKTISSKIKTNEDGTATLAFTVISQAPNAAREHGGTSGNVLSIEKLTNRKFDENDFRFITNQIWTVYQDGSIELQSNISSNEPKFVLPRLGYSMTIPKKYNNFTYYGRGPIGNYNDRKTSQNIEKYNTTVNEEFINFPKPQDMGNHEETRWCALTNNNTGAVFISNNSMSVSALPYTAQAMATSAHIYELPKTGDTTLHLDVKVSGLGGASCGQGGPLTYDRVYADQYDFGFIIRPAGEDINSIVHVAPAGEVPIGMTRSTTGAVSLSSRNKSSQICYSLNGGKTHNYIEPIPLRTGGTVKAWFKDNKDSEISITFNKIETIKTTVAFVSSEEPGSGNTAKNLVDGDPATIWHTMYSVTVAQFPHWVDFDCGEAKSIKGFSYMPRQDGGNNGNIKDYTIHTSLDGKNWGEPLHTGKFSSDSKAKRIVFKVPIKARFIRLTGKSSHNGQDFASGASFDVLAE